MVRRTVAITLLFISISTIIMVPVLTFTPMGKRLFDGFTLSSHTSMPTFAPITPTPTPKPTPILTIRGKPPEITASEAILLDNDTGHILDDLNGERPLPMASTTKIMTALITIQAADLNKVVTIERDALNEVILHNGSSAKLQLGDRLTLKDLLYGMMLPSGDDAAIAIADVVGGSTANFVSMMNLFAYRLHLFQTHYINSDGLTYYDRNGQPIPGHYTTAYDLVRLARYAMTIPLFAQIVRTQHYQIPATASHFSYSWDNINALLKAYPGATGIKTGFTAEAGECLVFSATRNGHHLIGVVLHSIDENHRFIDARILLDWGFSLPLLAPGP